MGAGRCGSSGLVSFLNQKPDFHIYGENNNIIYTILNSVNHDMNKIIREPRLSNKIAIQKYTDNYYSGTEWYNPRSKLNNLKNSIINCVLDYFDNPENYIGFKEIRWLKTDINYLSFFENHFNVKYIHLTRNIDDQIKSMNRAKWIPDNRQKYITNTNEAINNFLTKKPVSQYIVKNISIDKNFQEEIYNFILG